jgi:hypothetical protein
MNAYVDFLNKLRTYAQDLCFEGVLYPLGNQTVQVITDPDKAGTDDQVKGMNMEIHAWRANSLSMRNVVTFPIHWELARKPDKGVPWCLQQIRLTLPLQGACLKCGAALTGVMAINATLCGLCGDDVRNGR